jgi:hypothetical protein
MTPEGVPSEACELPEGVGRLYLARVLQRQCLLRLGFEAIEVAYPSRYFRVIFSRQLRVGSTLFPRLCSRAAGPSEKRWNVNPVADLCTVLRQEPRSPVRRDNEVQKRKLRRGWNRRR